jgi:large subunit ribosomal protein L29
MKPSELRDKSDEELVELTTELREQIVKLRVGRASSRRVSTAQFSRIRRDIGRIKTIQTERQRGLERE